MEAAAMSVFDEFERQYRAVLYELESKRKSVEDYQSSYDQLQLKMLDVQRQSENEKREIEVLRQHLDLATSAHKNIEEKLNEASGSQWKTSIQLETLEMEKKLLREQLSLIQTENTKLKATVAQLTDENQCLVSYEDDINTKLAHQRNLVDHLKKAFEALGPDINRALGMESKLDECLKLTDVVAHLKAKNAEQNGKMKKLDLQLIEKNAEIDMLKSYLQKEVQNSAIQAEKSHINMMQSTIDLLRDRLFSECKERANLVDCLGVANATLKTQEERYLEVEADRAKLEAEIEALKQLRPRKDAEVQVNTELK